MCDKSKVYIDGGKFARDTTSCKCDCSFDAVGLTKDNVCVLQIREAGHNHEPTLPGTYLTHKKTAMTQNVQQQIAHQAQIGTSSKQTLSILRLDNDEEILYLKHKIYTIFGKKSEKKFWKDFY